MEEEKYIILSPEQLRIMLNAAVTKTLEEIGIKSPKVRPWITQNQAHKLAGRVRVDRAMREGRVRWHKEDIDRKLSRVYINRQDIERLINERYH